MNKFIQVGNDALVVDVSGGENNAAMQYGTILEITELKWIGMGRI